MRRSRLSRAQSAKGKRSGPRSIHRLIFGAQRRLARCGRLSRIARCRGLNLFRRDRAEGIQVQMGPESDGTLGNTPRFMEHVSPVPALFMRQCLGPKAESMALRCRALIPFGSPLFHARGVAEWL